MDSLPPSVRRRLENDEGLKEIGKRRGDQLYEIAKQKKEASRLSALDDKMRKRITDKWKGVYKLWEQRSEAEKNLFKMESPRFEALSMKAFEIIKQNDIDFQERIKQSIETTEQAYAATRTHLVKLSADITKNEQFLEEKRREDALMSCLYHTEDRELSELVSQYHNILTRIANNSKSGDTQPGGSSTSSTPS
eukprot:TRINITY_DN22799_c0_g1_i1.p1 TRINITY_DN22799_c0_g1~~TRINITY_DN22799_c0_g1_i1.p1  ORF type:complete len:193 (+),score=37.66 TRINITY_DN22799_c0_g1_i1:24-602(+)